MANVGKNIRLLRKQKGMTQDGLAELLYVSRQTVSNYENGKSNPDIDMLIRIAEVLEADVDALIFGVPVPPSVRREWFRLLCGAALFLLLGILDLRLGAWAEEWRQTMFDLGPSFALLLLLRPLFCLVLGWTLMQTVSLLWGTKRQSGKLITRIYWIVLLLLGLYAFLMVPFCAERLFASRLLLTARDHSGIPTWLPAFWGNLVFSLWIPLQKCRFLFIPAGVVLWNGRGKRL